MRRRGGRRRKEGECGRGGGRVGIFLGVWFF